MPSKLSDLYWSHTYRDLRTTLRLKVEAAQTAAFQDYENLMLVAVAILGKKKGKGRPSNVMVPRNEAELRQAMSAVFGGSG